MMLFWFGTALAGIFHRKPPDPVFHAKWCAARLEFTAPAEPTPGKWYGLFSSPADPEDAPDGPEILLAHGVKVTCSGPKTYGLRALVSGEELSKVTEVVDLVGRCPKAAGDQMFVVTLRPAPTGKP